MGTQNQRKNFFLQSDDEAVIQSVEVIIWSLKKQTMKRNKNIGDSDQILNASMASSTEGAY